MVMRFLGILTCWMRPLGWMSTCLSGPLPEFTNLWGTPAGATTLLPALTHTLPSPTGETGPPAAARVNRGRGAAGRRLHALPGATRYPLLAGGEGGLTVQRHEDLLVRMGVQ